MMPLGLCPVLYPCLFSSVKGIFGLFLMQGKLTYGKIGEWRFDKRSYTKIPPPKNLTLPPPGVPESVVWLSQLAFMSILSCLTLHHFLSVMFTHKFIHSLDLVHIFLNSTWYTYYKWIFTPLRKRSKLNGTEGVCIMWTSLPTSSRQSNEPWQVTDSHWLEHSQFVVSFFL